MFCIQKSSCLQGLSARLGNHSVWQGELGGLYCFGHVLVSPQTPSRVITKVEEHLTKQLGSMTIKELPEMKIYFSPVWFPEPRGTEA